MPASNPDNDALADALDKIAERAILLDIHRNTLSMLDHSHRHLLNLGRDTAATRWPEPIIIHPCRLSLFPVNHCNVFYLICCN